MTDTTVEQATQPVVGEKYVITGGGVFPEGTVVTHLASGMWSTTDNLTAPWEANVTMFVNTENVEAVQHCDESHHPEHRVHLHWDRGRSVTHSRLDYDPGDGTARIPGFFSKDASHRVNPVVETAGDPSGEEAAAPNKWDAVLAAVGDTTPSGRWPNRLIPVRPVTVRATFDGRPIGGLLGAIDTRDADLTYLVIWEQGAGLRPRDLAYGVIPGFLDDSLRYREGWVSDVEIVDAAPEPDWAPGMKFRVTSTSGAHMFPVGTIVTALRDEDGANRNSLGLFHATRREVEAPFADLPQEAGVTAWVSGSGRGQNVVRYVEEPEPEERAANGSTPEWPVSPCTIDNHSVVSRIHYHVDMPGSDTHGYNMRVHESDGYTTVQGARFSREASDWTSHGVNPEPEQVVPEPSADIPPPEEVLRLLRDEHPALFPEERERIASLIEQVTAARARVDDARQERAQWLDRLIDRSREVADEQDWCEVYDRGMEELGLPSREDREPETEEVTVTATIEVSFDFDEDKFVEWFDENVSEDHGNVDSHSTTFTVNLSLTRDFTVNENECACDDSEHLWEGLLPSWVADQGCSWSVYEMECCND